MKFSSWFKEVFSGDDSDRFVVYVLREANGSVLYVGRTTLFRLRGRMRDHYKQFSWAKEVDNCKLYAYRFPETAIEIERRLIHQYKPLHNIRGNEQEFYRYHGRPGRDPRSWSEVLAGAPYPDE